ncbi:hypothetical protein QJS10_CPB14g01472 [Acorus calamus]|uniref:DM2 domain-containing protein n=1 Tax=Acorus calamus TaxID=4465 RepID=A0AAV9DDP2_ACOCL|nr:hypothetical protein QJS10_CPB14g01472 [Acorus calamus]
MSRVFVASRALMAAVSAAGKASSPSSPAASAAPKRGFQVPRPISPALRKFLGGPPSASRTDAMKKIWEHIKANDLQNPANKREINCDEKLKSIFNGKDKVEMMEIAKLLSPHFLKSN